MGKQLIIEAWAKYRPTSRDGSPSPGNSPSSPSPNRRNIGEIYGEGFLAKLMKGVRLKKMDDGEKLSGIERMLMGDGDENDDEEDNPVDNIPEDEV